MELIGSPPATRGVSLALDGVTHRFGATVAVDQVSLAVAPGEIVALLGPSGCGKTTLLRIVAGLLRQSHGHVAIGGDVVDDLPPNERGAGIVFQNYALFPHMTVEANVAYGLRARGTARREIAERVARMLELVRMQGFERRLPRELSGGQQQRVALARTLAVSPRVLLLDEPFGALDKNLRLDMQIEVKRLQRELDITTIMVTHDQEEALSLADRIAVMSRGRVEQLAAPEDIYDRPVSLFVATFVGTANLFRGTLAAQLSLEVAAVATLIATLLGVAGAHALARRRAAWARVLDSVFMSPLMLPTLALGLALLVLFNLMGSGLSKTTLVIGHVAICAPYIVRTTSASLVQLDPALLDSARSLGARPWFTFRTVTLPLIAPGIAAGAFLAFMASFDNVAISLFLSDARSEVLPIRMWHIIESNLDVRAAAASGVLIAGAVVLMLVLERLTGVSRHMR